MIPGWDTPRWTAPLWAAWRAGEGGWKVHRGDDDPEEIVWITRRVTSADVARFPELAAARWVLIDVDGDEIDGEAWPCEPGRRLDAGERLVARDPEELKLPRCLEHPHGE